MEKFLARTGSRHKICSPGSARLEKYRLGLGPARRKTGSTQPYIYGYYMEHKTIHKISVKMSPNIFENIAT